MNIIYNTHNASRLKKLMTGCLILCTSILFFYGNRLHAQTGSRSASQRVNDRIEYINKYKSLAVKQMQEHGIPASIILAQACLESGNGKSTLAVKANNHFGIKCHSNWTGATVRHDDDAKGECFRKYKSAEQSYQDHSRHLTTQRRYASLFDLKKTDYRGWAKGLKAAGYATNPNYAIELIKIIEDYELYKYDSGNYTADVRLADMTPQEILVAEADIAMEGIAEGAVPLESSALYAYSTSRQLYAEEDGRAYIFANEGDTYQDIAKEYRLFNREIRRFNNAGSKDTLRAGSKVYLEKQKKK